MIHRDLKPDNVLVVSGTSGDTAKIVDFGLAKIVDDESATSGELTTAGKVFGTPAYLSPEQAAGKPADVASDLYALGALLYRARSGAPPFSGTALELIAQHLHEKPAPLGGDAVDTIILQLLEKDPARRPGAEEVVRRLGELAPHDSTIPRVGG